VGRALAQVVSSIRAAAPKGGKLSICGTDGDPIGLTLVLSAPVVDIGSDDWNAAGMGLWDARRVFDDHHGRLIDPPTPSGETVQWRVELPRAKRQA
jgi:hypothetical protein